jgi:MFS transporter, ACS family, glucarate transporter
MAERGIVVGINFSGSRFGAAFSLPAIAWLIHATGWRYTFMLLGLIGIVWALFWRWLFRDDPSQHPFLSDAEREHILRTRQRITHDAHTLSLSDLARSGNVWWMMIQYFCNNYTFFFALTWLFPYLQEKFHLGPVQTGWLVAVPLVTGGLGNWLSGLWVDSIFKGGQWTRSRRLPALTGFFLSAVGLTATVYMDNIWLCIFFLSLTIFGADMTMSPSWSTCTDIGKKNSGIVSGAMNMTGNLGAFVTALAFPYLKDWFGSEYPFFFIGSALSLVGMFCWTRVNPERGVIEELRGREE